MIKDIERKISDSIENRTSDIRACGLAPQPSTLLSIGIYIYIYIYIHTHNAVELSNIREAISCAATR
jgi:hypothetical protein